MRLGFHYHVPAISRDGAVYMPAYFGSFIESLASYCEQLLCFLHSPRPDEIELMDYRILAPNVSLIDIGPHLSVPQRIVTSHKLVGKIRGYITELDMLLLRGPSPLLPKIADICQDIPKALLLVGNQLDGVNDLPQPKWRKEIIRLFWKWNINAQRKISKHSLTFVNSRKLFEEYKGTAPRLVETHTTTLHQDDLYVREDTCQKQPVNLVYAGRVDRTKGLMEIGKAVVKLNQNRIAANFHIIGPKTARDPILEDITNLFGQYKLGDSLIYHGYKSLPEVFQLYRQLDIFVIASTNEGFPRVIWEAMANSLPVVATRVGSIPAYIEGAAELVQPRDADALTCAIIRLINQPDLRRRNIQRGLELARSNTLEVQIQMMLAEMKKGLP